MAVGRIFGGVIKKVAKALTCQHRTGKSLGLSCRKMYITKMNFKLSEPPSTSNRSDDFEGIVNDLREFKILVNLVAEPKHDKDMALQLFNALFPTDAEYRDRNICTLN
ncbi:hypothetical protein POM88_041446 [Heracleum sosnowskyi]|uniref:Uncharacterized protein n=1 Tax=Heracleum sosnowskyi TaxID=360622 RepID=A0AAD8HE92_9APIA|nr:hypothetical protein POM88_041446 [Heracleum sosnowskyi]